MRDLTLHDKHGPHPTSAKPPSKKQTHSEQSTINARTISQRTHQYAKSDRLNGSKEIQPRHLMMLPHWILESP